MAGQGDGGAKAPPTRNFVTPAGRLSFPDLPTGMDEPPGPLSSTEPLSRYSARWALTYSAPRRVHRGLQMVVQTEEAHRKASEYVRRLAAEGIHPVGDGPLSDSYELTAEEYATAERIWKEIFH